MMGCSQMSLASHLLKWMGGGVETFPDEEFPDRGFTAKVIPRTKFL